VRHHSAGRKGGRSKICRRRGKRNKVKVMALGTYFLILSEGMAIAQKATEARPPERKLAEPVLIYLQIES